VRGVSCRQLNQRPWAAAFSAQTQRPFVAPVSVGQVLAALRSTGWQPQI